MRMKYISIRDLQKMSEKAIRGLPGPTTIQSGDVPVGLLIPFRTPDPKKLAAFLKSAEANRARALDAGLDEAAEDRALAKFGPVEPLDPLPARAGSKARSKRNKAAVRA